MDEALQAPLAEPSMLPWRSCPGPLRIKAGRVEEAGES